MSELAGYNQLIPKIPSTNPMSVRLAVSRSARMGNGQSRVHGSFVIGERGKETTVDVRCSPDQIRAQLAAYAADRRRRGISPDGILFEGEEA